MNLSKDVYLVNLARITVHVCSSLAVAKARASELKEKEIKLSDRDQTEPRRVSIKTMMVL
jgi:hypothetical protein